MAAPGFPAHKWHARSCFFPMEEGLGNPGLKTVPEPCSSSPVLQEFSKEERDPVKTHEGWGVMLPCNPPAHYPGKWGSWAITRLGAGCTGEDFRMLGRENTGQEVVGLDFKRPCSLLAGLQSVSPVLRTELKLSLPSTYYFSPCLLLQVLLRRQSIQHVRIPPRLPVYPALPNLLKLLPFLGLSYRWLLNEFPNFIPTDGRHFVSQTTGNLYIARTNASDLGNYSCLATSHMDFSTKSVFSKFAQLNLAAEGQDRGTRDLVGQLVFLEHLALEKGKTPNICVWRFVDFGRHGP